MALLMGITLPAGIEIIYNKAIKMYDLSIQCRVGKNPKLLPRKTFYNLKDITYLYDIAFQWSSLTQEAQDAWNAAAEVMGWHGYNLFTQDTSFRKKNAIPGLATPSIYHQYAVGHLGVTIPATSASFYQTHRKRPRFPADFTVRYKTDLIAAGGNPSAKIQVAITRLYGGETFIDTYDIDLPLSGGWASDTLEIVNLSGTEAQWELRIILTDVIGDLWFDNVFFEYAGVIKNNDPFCNDVVNNWYAVDAGDGVSFETIYPVGDAL